MSFWNETISEKRNGPDKLVKWVKIASYTVWPFLAAFILITDKAKPPQEGFFDRLYNVSVRTTWDEGLLLAAFIISVVLFILSIISLIFNSRRLKRKEDKVSISLIISLIISGIYIVIYLFAYYNALG